MSGQATDLCMTARRADTGGERQGRRLSGPRRIRGRCGAGRARLGHLGVIRQAHQADTSRGPAPAVWASRAETNASRPAQGPGWFVNRSSTISPSAIGGPGTGASGVLAKAPRPGDGGYSNRTPGARWTVERPAPDAGAIGAGRVRQGASWGGHEKTPRQTPAGAECEPVWGSRAG